MKKSKETKADLKSTSEPINKGRGGARPGAGRPSKGVETKQLHIDTPITFLDSMDKLGIDNRTAYILGLIDKDLKKKLKTLSK